MGKAKERIVMGNPEFENWALNKYQESQNELKPETRWASWGIDRWYILGLYSGRVDAGQKTYSLIDEYRMAYEQGYRDGSGEREDYFEMDS